MLRKESATIVLYSECVGWKREGKYLQNVDVSKILASLLDTNSHGLLGLTNPDTGIVELLVGLGGTIRVSDLGLEVALFYAKSKKSDDS